MELYYIYYFGSGFFYTTAPRFVHVSAYVSTPFILLMSSIPLCEYISQFVYPLSVDAHLVVFRFQLL